MGPRLRGDDSDGVGVYFVYMLASRRYGTLYIGVTNDLRTRLEQHRLGWARNLSSDTKFIAWFMSNLMRMPKTLSAGRSS
jgi:predicted GIY-YIG superfamily endonuclease